MMDKENVPAIRRIWLITIIGFAVLAGLYTGGWFYLGNQLQNSIDAWIEQQKHAGVQVRFKEQNRSGFPLQINLSFDQPVIISDKKPSGYVWQGQRAVVTMKLWQLRNIHMDLSGPQKIKIINNTNTMMWRGHAKILSAVIHLKSATQAAVTLNLEGIEMKTDATNKTKNALNMRLKRGSVYLMQNKKPTEKSPSLSIAADIADLQMPKSLPMILSHNFSKLNFSASVLGVLPRKVNPRSLLAWRDAGGTVEIDRVELKHGPLELQADGTIALDQNLQPVGAFSAKIFGFFDVIKVLRDRNLIQSNIALTANLVLGVLSKRQGPENKPRLDVSVSIQDRKLYVGPLAIAKMPFIHWDQIKISP